jgi:hypothetical protein
MFSFLQYLLKEEQNKSLNGDNDDNHKENIKEIEPKEVEEEEKNNDSLNG